MNTYECAVCGHLYSEADGDPLRGAPPGTKWDDLPEDWACPDCGADKDNFVRLED
jgi:rubredoxin-NAD+ reductase